MRHVAIVRPCYAAPILDGRKRFETRLMRARRAPLDCVAAGDELLFKVAGGPVFAESVVQRVLQFERLTARGVRRLGAQFGRQACAGAEYWRARHGCRYAVVVKFSPPAATRVAVAVPRQFGSAWVMLERMER
jgi:hypothetical protein